MRVLFIRHAESTANEAGELSTTIPGPRLTQRGHAQAEALSVELLGKPISGIYVSSMRRTLETAAPISRAIAVAPVVLPGLHEVAAGDFEGTTTPDGLRGYLTPIMSWAAGDFDALVPGAFNGRHFLSRFDQSVEAIRRQHEAGATVAVFSHSVAIRVWVGARAENVRPEFTAHAPLENCGSVSVVINEGRVKLDRWQGLGTFHV